MKILDLYAGVGGNRSLWGEDHEITAVELSPYIAGIYQDRYPKDRVIVADAHEFLEQNFMYYDYIWASPPCPTHSKLPHNLSGHNVYPDMKLWQEIIFLQGLKTAYPNIKWTVENVIMWYEPLIKPSVKAQRHYFWANFDLSSLANNKYDADNIVGGSLEELQNSTGINMSKYDIPAESKSMCLKNCVNRFLAKDILDLAVSDKQSKLNL